MTKQDITQQHNNVKRQNTTQQNKKQNKNNTSHQHTTQHKQTIDSRTQHITTGHNKLQKALTEKHTT